jgi:hypothetical protein
MTTPTLLGYLAKFGSFSIQSELLCTQGLTYLLQTYEDARSALADEVQTRTGVRIGDSLTWLPEALHDDGRRPDLEARTADGVPVVNIEAKLGAELLPDQLQYYVADLRERNSGDTALLVLVPKSRTAEAARVTADAFDLSGAGPWQVTDGHRTGIAVISWDELFTALRGCKTERFRHELEQLQAMYHELSSDFIAPLASDEDLREWSSSETNFVKLVDQVTRRLTKHHQIYPRQVESLEQASPDREPGEYYLRYVCSSADDAASCYSIGVRDSFAKWVTPIWMRFHRDTGNFRLIRQRIDSSDVRSLESGGHIWIPLDVPRDVSGKQMIQALVEQAEEVVRVACPAE